MKRLILGVCICALAGTAFLLPFPTASASNEVSVNNETKVSDYIAKVYRQIDFGGKKPLDYAIFEKAYRGYLNLQHAGKLNTDKQVLTICDLSCSSNENRFWSIDLKKKKLLFNTYVAHGQGSGEEFATSFSNKMNSHQSSLGFYVTGDTYVGEHGTSLHLHGVDNGFNDAAYERSIVVHGADYVSTSFINGNQRLGRSWGCPAVPNKLALPIINAIKDGTCLFVYAPQKQYLQTAYWLNKKVHLPDDSMFPDFSQPLPTDMITVEYRNSAGTLDSVVKTTYASLKVDVLKN